MTLVLPVVLIVAFASCGCKPGTPEVTGEIASATSQKTQTGAVDSVPSHGTRVDLGNLTPGQTVQRTVAYRNPHEFPVRVAGITSTCVCFAATISPEAIAPDEVREILVNYDAPEREGDDNRSLIVFFRESESEKFTIDVSARIRHKISVLPKQLVFDKMQERDIRRAQLVVENHTEDVWSEIEVEPGEAWLKTRIVENSFHDSTFQSFTIHVEVTGNQLGEGRNKTVLSILPRGIPNDSEAKLQVPIAVVLAPAVLVSPNGIIPGRIECHSRHQWNLTFRRNTDEIRFDGDTAVEIRNRQISNASLEIASTRLLDDTAISIDLEIEVSGQTGSFSEIVEFAIGDETVKVPISFFAESKK